MWQQNTEYGIHKSIQCLRFTSVMAKQCLHCATKMTKGKISDLITQDENTVEAY